MDALLASIAPKKAALPPGASRHLQKHYDIELHYTSNAIEGNTLKIPGLMQDFGKQLERAEPVPSAAFDAHFRLTAIHPFSDGNGRTARLLMNLLLIRSEYVPVAVRPEDRNVYLDALEAGWLAGDLVPFQTFMHRRLDVASADYIDAVRESLCAPNG